MSFTQLKRRQQEAIVNFPFIENDYYYDILLSFGDKCECLEPPHIRAEMKRKIQDIAALYVSPAFDHL
ncbi:WYL domain-containing protein [Oscillibacter sp.]|uniref:WYL domain-containing protein n=1 Tax=Oscillibacter sp. TaxID=1945593 RepID=UPI0037CB6382